MWQGLISILMFHISDVWQNIIKIAGSLFPKVYSVVPLPSCWPWLFLYWNGPKLQYGWWEVSLFIEFRITILEFLSLGYKKKMMELLFKTTITVRKLGVLVFCGCWKKVLNFTQTYCHSSGGQKPDRALTQGWEEAAGEKPLLCPS